MKQYTNKAIKLPLLVILSINVSFSFGYEDNVFYDTRAGFTFPHTISNFTFDKKDEFEDPKLGYSIQYANDNNIVANIYIYDLGLENISNGIVDPIIQRQFKQAIDELYTAMEMNIYQSVTSIENIKNFSPHFLQHSFNIVKNNIKRRSHVLIRGQNGKFLKVRITSPPIEELDTDVIKFVNELFEIISLITISEEDKFTRSELSIKDLSLLAEQGVAKDQYELAVMYDLGLEIQQDHNQAVIWYKKAAEQGLPAAQFRLGISYHEGLGIPQDFTKAALWLRKAAEQGMAHAQAFLGRMYVYGNGVPKSDTEAVKWFRKAAEQDLSEAQYYLGLSYLYGAGTSQDATEAVKWLRLAGEQGNSEAQHILGEMYYKGLGVPQDYTEALTWLDKASKQGSFIARNDLAWILATCPYEKFRDGQAALKLAKGNLAIHKNKEYGDNQKKEYFDLMVLDTLAAAYAETGQFDEAIKIQNKALSLVIKGHPPEDESSLQEQMQAHLNNYLENKPWRE